MAISIPAHIKRSNYNPFGDGQTNAKLDMDAVWTESTEFPVIGIETVADGIAKRVYIFNSTFKIENYTEKLLADGWYQVTPKDWKDSFYFNFNSGVLPLKEFLDQIPEDKRTFPKNRIAPNIAKISKEQAYEDLDTIDLGVGYNKKYWNEPNVHGRFPHKDGEETARGWVRTWGIKTDKNQEGSFKNLYTCFQPRDASLENDIKFERGIPSGAGWHHVGDPAETILNILNKNAIPFAVARTHGKTDSAYKLTENITAVWLQSDEVQVTRQGEFHWYLNPFEETVCTEIWVQNCVPNPKNNWGFACN